MIGIAGARSTIAQEFMALLPDQEFRRARLLDLPLDLPLYLVCAGYLAGKTVGDMTDREANQTWHSNFVEPARFCDRLFAINTNARVCLIGSESGFAGSYDMAYAGAKAALHLYVERKRLRTPGQQLICIAPTIVWDTAMTQRRHDLDHVRRAGEANRHHRWLEAREVALAAKQALCDATPFLSNTIIRLGAGLR